jgi:type 1 glutamine amidotransferase
MLRRALILVFLLLVGFTSPAQSGPARKLLLVGQAPDGHPPQTHEYNAGIRILAKLLEKQPDLEIMVVRGDGPWKEGPELIDRADGVVLFVSEGAKWVHQDPKRLAALQRLAARGGGLAALHWAMGTRPAEPIEDFVKLFGGCHGGPDRKYKVLEADVKVVDPKSPITTGITDFHVKEEFYYRLKFPKPAGTVQPILRTEIDGQPETVCWAWQRPDGGRSFGFSGLHFHENWQRPEYRRLIAQGVLWTLKQPIPEGGLRVELPEDELKVKN